MKKVTKFILKKGIRFAAKQAGKSAKDFAVNTAKEAALAYIHAATDQDLAGRPFRKMRRRDREAVLGMMRDFYSSAAVLTDGSEDIFDNDFNACISENPYLEGFVFAKKVQAEIPETEKPVTEITECAADEEPAAEGETAAAEDEAAPEKPEPKDIVLGYAMIAHSFSTEYGRPCIWIEDLYLAEEARGKGLASQFLEFLTEKYSDHIIRLESENENEHAMEVYKRKGFSEMPYVEMYRK
jgi:GNAT superfamily N-acetyltransferase